MIGTSKSIVHVCLESGAGATGAFVPDRPGCWVFGRTSNRALRKVRVVAREWSHWLSDHGEKGHHVAKLLIEPTEILRVDYNPVLAGKPEPLFWSEVPSVSNRDIQRTIRLMEYSRSDLLRLTSSLDVRTLRQKPVGKPRSIGDCLRHIAICEWWYVTRLNIALPREFPGDIFDLLHYTRKLAVETLRNLPKEKREGVFQPSQDPSPTCDLWTARKMLRRFVDHERLHTRYITSLIKDKATMAS
jgi:hypothetical protein